MHGSHRNPEVLRDRWTNIAETRGSSYSSCGSKVLTFSHMLGNHCFRFSLKPAQFPDGMHKADPLRLLHTPIGIRRAPTAHDRYRVPSKPRFSMVGFSGGAQVSQSHFPHLPLSHKQNHDLT